MLRHIVVLDFADGTTDEAVDSIATALRDLPNQIPELKAYTVGPDAGLATGNGSFGVVADFDDEAGYVVYASHQAHIDVIEQLIKPVLTGRSAVQLHC